jgi:hypothetical protein
MNNDPTDPSPHAALFTIHSAFPTTPTQPFRIVLTVHIAPSAPDSDLLTIPGVVCISRRAHDPRDRTTQNYPAYPMPDGSVPVLEASITLYAPQFPAGRRMLVGMPVAMLAHPTGTHEVMVEFTGVRWSLSVDGMLYDNDFPLGYPHWPATPSWHIDATQVTQAALWLTDATTPPAAPEVTTTLPSVQYWTPPGHNTWVGDVVSIMHAGRYHLFYLTDRRHHQSKFGMGAHYFAHLSTTDFHSWTVHPDATPLTAQWQCIGTGTPFVDNAGRLCLAYALHTERLCADGDTTLPAQLEWLARHGATGTFDQTTPGVPIGSTYAISGDGVADFHPSGIFFHPCRNPSIYRDPHGELRMLANYAGAADASWGKGIWAADTVDGGWHCINADFPPGGDCTFFFRWGDYDYIIGGFVNLWLKPAEAPDSTYVDLVAAEDDCYDGLNVPTITQVAPGRLLMAGWCAIRGWGGALVIRDLVQHADGRLGTRWMPELLPQLAPHQHITALTAGQHVVLPVDVMLLEFTVDPAAVPTGCVDVRFGAQAGAPPCALQIDLRARRAQYSTVAADGMAAPQGTLRAGGNPAQGGDYAIANLRGIDAPFAVRILIIRDTKLGGTLIDCEIAGQRTMLTFRPDVWVSHVTMNKEE